MRNPFLLLINAIASGRPWWLIPNADGTPYLLRLLLRGFLPTRPRFDKDGKKKVFKWSSYLHLFLSKDMDRELHNHPWSWCISIVVWGGYVEERRSVRTGKNYRRRLYPFWLNPFRCINVLGSRNFHRITEIKGKETWTLVLAGAGVYGWGFLEGAQPYYVRSRIYLKRKGYPADSEGPERPLPPWLLQCACCENHFPPPGRYSVRPSTQALANGTAGKPLCDACATLPYTEAGELVEP